MFGNYQRKYVIKKKKKKKLMEYFSLWICYEII